MPKLFLKQQCKGSGCLARAYARILKLSRTIADLEAAADIHAQYISEAIQYRTLDREQY